jgi:hypothetical protein
MDGLHAGNILCGNAQGCAFALVGDRTLEDDKAVGNDDVYAASGSPRLSIDLAEDLIADLRVGCGATGLSESKPTRAAITSARLTMPTRSP